LQALIAARAPFLSAAQRYFKAIKAKQAGFPTCPLAFLPFFILKEALS
jgi:hypothetical protein